MAILVYVAEAMVYRTVGMIDANLAALGTEDPASATRRIEEYAVECSIIKVWGSEMLDYVVDETVQIYGGYGFVEDYPAERAYRDARVNRIFEGTNEINRLLVPGRLLRRAMKGELPVFQKAMALMDELTAGPAASAGDEDAFLGAEARMAAGAKKVALACLGLATQKFGAKLDAEQEVLGHFADVAMETYALEGAVLRAQKRAAAPGRGQRAAAGGRGALLRPGRAGPHRGLGAQAARGRRRRRHLAHLPRGPQALHQARDAEHSGAAPAGGRGRDRAGGLSAGLGPALATHEIDLRWARLRRSHKPLKT